MSKQNGTTIGVEIKRYSHKELAAMYGVSWPTFKRWLKPIEHLLGEKNGHYWMPEQVKIIYRHLGPPSSLLEIE